MTKPKTPLVHLLDGTEVRTFCERGVKDVNLLTWFVKYVTCDVCMKKWRNES